MQMRKVSVVKGWNQQKMKFCSGDGLLSRVVVGLSPGVVWSKTEIFRKETKEQSSMGQERRWKTLIKSCYREEREG